MALRSSFPLCLAPSRPRASRVSRAFGILVVRVAPGLNACLFQVPDYMEKSGGIGTVPMIDDNGFFLSESHAILTYLGDKMNWKTYPKDLKIRAKIQARSPLLILAAPSAPLLSADCSAGRSQEYFNWHHRNTREITISSFAPAMRPDLGLAPSPINPATLKTIERWLGESAWLIGDQPTVADFSCFCELGQAQSHLCDFIDFGTRRAAFSELNPSQFSKKSCAAQSRSPTLRGGWARASSWMDSRRATRCCSRSGRSSLRRSRRRPNSS